MKSQSINRRVCNDELPNTIKPGQRSPGGLRRTDGLTGDGTEPTEQVDQRFVRRFGV